MKYILNENIRYILNEADGDEAVTTSTDKATPETSTDNTVSALVAKLKTILGENNENLRPISSVLSSLRNVAELSSIEKEFSRLYGHRADIIKLKEIALKYVDQASSIIAAGAKINNAATEIAEEIKSQKEIIENATNNDMGKLKINQTVYNVEAVTNQTINNMRADAKAVSQGLVHIEELQKVQIQLYADLDKLKDIDILKKVKVENSELNTLAVDCLTNDNLLQNIEKLNTVLKTIKLSISEVDNVIKQQIDSSPAEEQEQEQAQEQEFDATTTVHNPKVMDELVNWKEMLAKPEAFTNPDTNKKFKSVDEVWSVYYKKVWGSQAPEALQKKLALLGEPFTEQLFALGFTERTNPFITFLKNNYITPTKLMGLAINRDSYAAIHNAYVYKYVPNEALTATGDEKANWVLYNPELYQKASKPIFDYLSLDHEAKDALSKGKFVNSRVAAVYKNNATVLLMNNLFIKGFTILGKKTAEGVYENNPNNNITSGNLKSIENIELMLKDCFGKDIKETGSKEKIQLTSDKTEDILKKVPITVCENLAKYLAIKYLSTSELDKYTELDKTLDLSRVKDYEKFLAPLEITSAIAAELIKKLLIKAGKVSTKTDTTDASKNLKKA